MPLRLNIDQVKVRYSSYDRVWTAENSNIVFVLKDALFFLKDFFSSLATEVEFFSPPAQEGKTDDSMARLLLKILKQFHDPWSLLVSAAVCVSTKKAAAPEISCSFSKHATGSLDPAPIISVPAQRQLSHNGFSAFGREEANNGDSSASPFTDQPIFFRSEEHSTRKKKTKMTSMLMDVSSSWQGVSVHLRGSHSTGLPWETRVNGPGMCV